MRSKASVPDTLLAWSRLSKKIHTAIRGLDEPGLDLRDGHDGWSIREYVHHLVESNLIATGMILRALATDAGYYDWTWVNPDRTWMRRLGYDKAPVDPAIKTLATTCRHFSGLLAAVPDALARTVTLRDAPDAPLYTRTLDEVLQREIGHVTMHLDEVSRIRVAHSR